MRTIQEQALYLFLKKLSDGYGIIHNDPEGNFVIIGNKKGQQSLGVIDFEDWDDVIWNIDLHAIWSFQVLGSYGEVVSKLLSMRQGQHLLVMFCT
jgi:hypothetical protein